MKYLTGEEIRVGDRVNMGRECPGIVLTDLALGAYTGKVVAEDWNFLGRGILFEFECAGIVYVENATELGGIQFVERAARQSP